MKNFRQCKQEEEETAATDLLRSINCFMSTQRSHGCFDRVNLEGKNLGASMTMQPGSSSGGKPLNRCNINIYINSNVQGVNNSILVGSEVKMVDPGVCTSRREVKLGKGFQETNKRRNSGLGFFGMFLVLVVVILLLALLF
ncbi:xyloglucan galactosyltransferase [Sarracenia purpurea var. burkii]